MALLTQASMMNPQVSCVSASNSQEETDGNWNSSVLETSYSSHSWSLLTLGPASTKLFSLDPPFTFSASLPGFQTRESAHCWDK